MIYTHCKCGRKLNEYEIDLEAELDGMCEECYATAMEAAYSDKKFEDLDI